MTWAIASGGKPIWGANHNDQNNDSLDMHLSLFRGPNYLLWYCYQSDKALLSQMVVGNTFNIWFFQYSYAEPYIDIEVALDSITWDARMECWEFYFVPTLWRYLKSTIDVYKAGTLTLDVVIGEIIKACYSKASLVLSPKLKSVQFNGYHGTGVGEVLLAELCAEYGFEFFVNGSQLIVKEYLFEGRDRVFYVEDNVIVHYTDGAKNITAGRNIGNLIPMPGQSFAIGVEGSKPPSTRCVHVEYRYEEQEIKTLFTAIDARITEVEMLHTLPFVMRQQLEAKILFKPQSVKIGKVNSVKEDLPYEEQVRFPGTSNDASNLVQPDKGSDARVIVASPYAGDGVGIQFPQTKGNAVVVASPQGKQELGIQIGAIYQPNEEPTRDSPKDFRLTLPDGGTLYYSKDNGAWIMAGKSKVLIGQYAVTSTGVPSPDSNYIEITSTGVKICGTVQLATENHQHYMEHIQVATAPGAPTAPMTCKYIPGGPTKVSKPDKITQKVKGDEIDNTTAALGP